MANTRTLVALLCTVMILGIGVAVAVYFGLTMGMDEDDEIRELTSDGSTGLRDQCHAGVEPILDSKGAALSFFSQTDGLDIRWYSQANTKQRLNDALTGNYMMLSSDVSLRTDENGTNIPVMGDTSSTLSLEEWLKRLKSKEKIGCKLTFAALETVAPALTVVKRADLGGRPVWLEANAMQGKGDGPVLDSNKFIELVQSHYPRAVLSFGWTTECCDGVYTQAMVEKMYRLVKRANYHITFMVRTSWLKRSLESIYWLLKQSDRFSVTVWSPPDSVSWENVNAYDLIKLRNAHSVERIYYQLQGKMMDSFLRTSVTAGSPLNVFKFSQRDGIDVTWSHATNTREKHKQALRSRDTFLEADVVLNSTGVPIMAHPPDTTSDLSFSDFVDGTMLTNKGMKLDFKSTDAINPALRHLRSKEGVIHQPVFVNADILTGPGGRNTTPVDGAVLKRFVINRFPQCTLSLGWTTGVSETEREYTSDHIDAMLAFIASVHQPITYAVRADLVRASWRQLSRLLEKDRSSSLTVWSNDQVDVDDLVWIRGQADRSRVYYDLPDLTMQQFRSRI